MAAPKKASNAYQRGSMEISEQSATWDLFMFLSKWGSLATSAILLWLVLWFMPNGSFVTGAGVAIVFSAVGWFFLRAKKTAAH